MSVVVGYIDTPEGRAALERGKAEARLRDATLVVAHSRYGDGRSSDGDSVVVERDLELIDRRLDADRIPHRIRRLTKGQSPGEDLVEILEEEHAALVVIGLRKRPLTGEPVVGDTAATLLMRSTCPVMCIRA
jgi:nucleotide-binding universal stress UspA family protein